MLHDGLFSFVAMAFDIGVEKKSTLFIFKSQCWKKYSSRVLG